MNRTLPIIFMLLALTAKAQQKLSYAYDAAGNRTERTIVMAARSADAGDKTQDAVPTLLEHGWRATTLPVGGDLPAAWDQLTGGIR